MNEKALKFGITGAVGTTIDIGVLSFLVEVVGLPVILANTFSFTITISISFFIHKYWTFQDTSAKTSEQFLKYFLISLTGLAVSNVLLSILLNSGIWYLFGKIITVFVVFFWSFFANSLVTFKRSGPEPF